MATLILVGPTASGKTGVAHELARRHHAAILSADAMMVYRGMDIGTAKPTPQELAEFHYQGVNLADPDAAFSVYDYAKALTSPLPPIVVGGTGLYVRGLVRGLDAEAGADPALREEAVALLEREGFAALKAYCRQRCPEIDQALPVGDRENPRRWIRFVERGTVSSAYAIPPRLAVEECVVIGLSRSRDDLQSRISQRVHDMFKQGLLDEARRLRAGELSLTAMKAIGYSEAGTVLDGVMTEAAAKEQMILRTRQYAKRQMTWFRHQLPTRWIEAAPDEPATHLADRLEKIWHG